MRKPKSGTGLLASVLALTAAVSIATSTATAHDLNPAPFRGQPGASYQAWEFLGPLLGPPDGYCPPQNPAGVAIASAGPGATYLPMFAGMPGVWCLSQPGAALNFQTPCAGGPPFFLKTIYVQMTLHFHSTTAGIEIEVNPPGGAAMVVGKQDLPVPGKGPLWVHRTVAVCIFQCPPIVDVSLVCTGLPTDHVDIAEVVIEAFCDPDICYPPPLPLIPGDYDGDGLTDTWDNAPGVFNPNQSDCDGDGIGDVSDTCKICDAASPHENEPCGTNTNGGCNRAGEPTTAIGCNDEVCGNTWALAAMRDTDWYELNLPDNDGDGKADLLLEVCTALPVVVFVFTDDCTIPIPAAAFDADLDRPGSITVCLDAPKVYRIFVAPGTLAGAIFNGYPCDGFQNEYWLRVWCAEPCNVCGVAGGNNCCVASPNASPGCDDGECCAEVCAIDPFCCGVNWDGVCAALAGTLCRDICCTGDINGDGIVNGADLAIVLGNWGANYIIPADINGDCLVDGADLAIVLGQWGPC